MKKEITDREILIRLITGNGVERSIGATTTMSIRLPIQNIMKVEAMARKAGVSRNKMFAHLLDLAVMEVEEHGDPVLIPQDIWDKYVKDSVEFQEEEL